LTDLGNDCNIPTKKHIPIGKVGIMPTPSDKVDFAALKSGGYMRQRQANLFSVRVRVLIGNLASEQMAKVAEIANKYGSGYIHLTVRQGIEIPYVHLDNLNTVTEELASVGLQLGACGPRVRVVTACQGSTLCPHGLGRAAEFAIKLDQEYYGRSGLPHKFKIGVTGCPNSCIKPQENDVGFVAVAEPVFDESDGNECISCGLCEETCPQGAISLVDGRPVIDLSKCSNDGKCISVCPTTSIRAGHQGWNLFVGGKWGREPQLGELFASFLSEEEGLNLVGRILVAFASLAKRGERLGSLVNRLGLEKFKEEVLKVSDEELP
jgi:dissimilatory sulfite reductase (desulfoviridin) alpha/beta subunit